MGAQRKASRRFVVVMAGLVVVGLAFPGRGRAMDLTTDNGVPLTLAAAQGDLQKVHSLLIAGTSPNLTDASGRPAIAWAALGGYTGIVEELLKAPHIVPDARDAQGNTALILAAQKGFADTVETLIRAKVNLNIDNHDGLTALMVAAQNDYLRVVQELVKAGADTTIQDQTGRTALDWAQDNGRQDVVNFLKRVKS